jgi:hypothetical protein
MSPMQYDPNSTSPIDRDELRALLCRVRDNATQPGVVNASRDRVADVVVRRAAIAAWLGREGG